MAAHRYDYVTYIAADPATIFDTFIDADQTEKFWSHRNDSTWEPGDQWFHRRLSDGQPEAGGTILASEPPHKLVMTFDGPEVNPELSSVVTLTLSGWEGITQLRLAHTDLPDETAVAQVGLGWPAVLANLKTLVETGHPLPRNPWEMPQELV